MPAAPSWFGRFPVIVLILMALVAPHAFAADDSAATPAATKPVASDAGADAVLVARAFFRAVIKPDDQAAYALVTSEFREGTSQEQFSEKLKELRESANLTDLPPVSGWVVVKPKEGEARRALLATSGMMMMTRRRNAVRGPDGRPAMPAAVGLELTEQDGKWLVAGVSVLKMEKADGRIRFAPGMEAREFAAPIESAGRKDGSARQVSSSVIGVLTDVKEGSITLKVTDPQAGPDAQPVERTFKVDDKTSVAVGTESERMSRSGRPSKVVSYRFVPASELKPGHNATIEPGDADDYAADVRAIQPAESGESGL